MVMKTYLPKNIEAVEAIQYTIDNAEEIELWVNGYIVNEDTYDLAPFACYREEMSLVSKGKMLYGKTYDYVVKMGNQFSIMNEQAFHACYEVK
jgi:hypothetical protein